MRNSEVAWRDYLWKTFEITPESRFLGISELETMLHMRDYQGWPYKPITYIEYVESIYGNGLIPKKIEKLKIFI